MNWYSYTFFTVFIFYRNWNIDRDYDVFAVSFFSFVIISFVITINETLVLVLKYEDFLLSGPLYLPLIGGLIFIGNAIMFLRKKKQKEMFKLYKRNSSTAKDILAILFIVLSIAGFIWSIS